MSQDEPRGPAWLLLPTYNEAGNIEGIVRSALANMPTGSRVLVVDDNSPDGTGDIAERLGEELPVGILHRQGKEGLASAYIAGFRHALERGAGLVLQMDADFSHDPADLQRLIEAAENADLVLGSRYVEGGGSATGASSEGRSAAASAPTRGSSLESGSGTSPAVSSAFAARPSRASTSRASPRRAMASRSR